ncbi:MAG: hypothetical protein K0Q49_2503, partial [Haloplasmataceae bacterium]|nr:hypothetical protein [Haloplasmataceae bacterium]
MISAQLSIETKIVGIQLQITYESRGYGYVGFEYAKTDYLFAKKVITEGEIS